MITPRRPWLSGSVRTAFAVVPAGRVLGQLAPKLDQCTLSLDQQTLTPVGTSAEWSAVHWVGDRRFVVRDGSIAQLGPTDGETAWTLQTPDGYSLEWLAASDDILFLRGYDLKDDPNQPRFDSPPIVRRVDLAAGKWLAPLALPVVENQPGQYDVIVASLAGKDRLAVLTEQWIPGNEYRYGKAVTYRLSLFRNEATAPAWSQTFDLRPPRPGPGGPGWSVPIPDYVTSDLVQLNWVGDDDLLLCRGETEDLICLSAAGTIKWRVPEICEYQRGFVGPSAWLHYISRFGFDKMGLDLAGGGEGWLVGKEGGPGTPAHAQAVAEARGKLAAIQQAFYQQFRCAIVGGPVVVTVHEDGEPDSPQIFVAVARGPNSWSYGPLSECLIYELSGGGEVEGMTSLPQMIHGPQFAVTVEGVVWACRGKAIVNLLLPNDRPWVGMGPGASDLLCAINWYRQISAPEIEAWLTAEKAGDITVFSPTDAFRTIAGGFIVSEAEKIYRFPIAIIDLKTGADRIAILHVPFAGDLPVPETNFSDCGGKLAVLRPYYMGITALQIHGSLLEITLGGDQGASSVVFDVAPFL